METGARAALLLQYRRRRPLQPRRRHADLRRVSRRHDTRHSHSLRIMMNLHQSKPLHYGDINPGLWGTCLLELAKDIAAVKIVEHLEEAQRGRIPDAEEYFILDWSGVVTWWSP